MRRIVGSAWPWLVGVAVATTALGQQGPQAKDGQPARVAAAGAPPAAAAPDPAAMERLLQAWAQQSAKVKSLDAKFHRVDSQPEWMVTTFYEGRALLQAPNKAWLIHKKIETGAGNKPLREADGKPVSKFYEKIICNGAQVFHYKAETQQLFIYTLDKDKQKRALEEGPLPFMFDFRIDEAKKRYDMSLLGENDTHYQVLIIPKLKDDRDGFIKATVWLDKKTFLPAALRLTSPNGKDTQTYTFQEIRADVQINPANFVGEFPRGWQVNRDPVPGQGAPGNAPPLRPQPVQRPQGLRGMLRR
jgi:TIGR03009 family protein